MLIKIPHELKPASLLWTEDLCKAAKDLRQSCRKFHDNPDLRLLGLWKQDAEHLLRRGNETGCAVILICLSDLYREYRKLSHAEECSEEAERYLSQWPERKHRHNYAVALYSLGLVYENLGSETEALDRYDEALDEFAAVRKAWILEGNDSRRKQCEMVSRWLEQLRERLAHKRSTGQPAKRTRVDVPVISSISAGEPALAGESFGEWQELTPRQADKIDFALKVDGDSMVDAKIADGDLVLIEQRQDQPTKKGQIVAIIIEGIDTEATLKRFYDEGDHIRLEPANDQYPLIILKDYTVPEQTMRAQYKKSHPNRNLKIYSDVDFQIVGWYKRKV